jgi:hypothetical protein
MDMPAILQNAACNNVSWALSHNRPVSPTNPEVASLSHPTRGAPSEAQDLYTKQIRI